MPKNTAETPGAEMPTKIGVLHNKIAQTIDRRLSVAPMIDWTDKPRKYVDQ
jgi:hypothetical protein